LYASSHLIKTVYGKDALARLDEEESDQEEDNDQDCKTCLVQVRPVELIELDELIIGALNEKSFDFAQKGRID
jgi:peroxin-6